MSEGLPTGWAAATLGEIAVLNPRSFTSEPGADDLVSFVPMAAVEEESGRLDASNGRPWAEVSKGYTRFEENDVLNRLVICFLFRLKDLLSTQNPVSNCPLVLTNL